MNRIIQLIKLILNKEFHNSIEHYTQDDIIDFYKHLEDSGLFPDELEVLQFIKDQNINSILLIGSGPGREAKVFAENSVWVNAIEPVEKMRLLAFKHPKINYFSQMNEVVEKEQAIYVTRNLLSLLNRSERNQLLIEIAKRMNISKYLFIQADIMELTWSKSFKLKLLEVLGKILKLQPAYEAGDTYRMNIDYNAHNNQWCYYHYFPEKSYLLNELKRHFPEAKIDEFSKGFFRLYFIKD